MKPAASIASVFLLAASLAVAAEPNTGLPALKPVAGKPLSMWFEFRTGDFAGASQIWGELRNDSKTPMGSVRILFVSLDANGKQIAASSDSVGKLAPGETWSFEIHPKETGVRRFELKDIEIAASADAPETCTLESQKKTGESCVVCDSWDGDSAKCLKRLSPQGYKQRCRGAGARTWSEVWCRAAK